MHSHTLFGQKAADISDRPLAAPNFLQDSRDSAHHSPEERGRYDVDQHFGLVGSNNDASHGANRILNVGRQTLGIGPKVVPPH
jgi:hypothetical protein